MGFFDFFRWPTKKSSRNPFQYPGRFIPEPSNPRSRFFLSAREKGIMIKKAQIEMLARTKKESKMYKPIAKPMEAKEDG